MSTTDKPTWQLAEQICEVPAVDEAIRTFVEDNTGDNAIGVVLAVLEHQAATEAAKATGTAQSKQSFENIEELPLHDGYIDIYDEAGRIGRVTSEKAWFEGSVRAYGQQCAEAARQPAPVVSASVDPDVPEALQLLSDVFDAWENGVDCYEDPEECAGFLGKAFQLDDEVFERCCALLNRRNPPRNAAPAATAAPVLSDERIYDFWLSRDCMDAIRAGDMKAQFIHAVRAILAFTFQPRIVSKDNASAFLEEKLWEFIDTAAAFPDCKPDDRTWEHVLAYKPKRVPIPAFALEGQQPSGLYESTQPEATKPAQDLVAAILANPPGGAVSELAAFQYWAACQDEPISPISAWNARAALASPVDALVAGDRVDAKDAERYRWLRNPDPQPHRNLDVCNDSNIIIDGKRLDDAIDAAIQAQKDGHG